MAASIDKGSSGRRTFGQGSIVYDLDEDGLLNEQQAQEYIEDQEPHHAEDDFNISYH